MDANHRKRRRESEKSRREKRWSMNSQRLEQIVAELMKPISDVRRSFDTDLSALLEEYLTEAGLHALEAGDVDAAADAVVPNFTELALLLQQSVNIYSHKVDFLYQHVLSVSDSLLNSTQEAVATENTHTPSGARRKRKSSAPSDFAALELEPCAGARRDGGAPRPPPTLPRMYIELEPRILSSSDALLVDYAAEPIGLLADFQVTWRLKNGLLVDELEGGSGGQSSLRALPLTELQAAIAAAAPPSPSPCPSPGAPPSPSPCVSPGTWPAPLAELAELPAPEPAAPTACSTPLPHPPPLKKERKRRSDVRLDDIVEGTVKLLISQELRQKLHEIEEFCIPETWISRVVACRKNRILKERRRLKEDELRHPTSDFRGFDIFNATDIGGFAGFDTSEAAEAAAEVAAALRRTRRGDDSDDDGFFEQSSLGDSDDSAHHHQPGTGPVTESAVGLAAGATEWAAWRDGVVARAAAAEARGFADMRAAGRCVLAAVQALPPLPTFDDVLAATVEEPTDVSRIFLATLFLANSGKLEIVPDARPLAVGSFAVRARVA